MNVSSETILHHLCDHNTFLFYSVNMVIYTDCFWKNQRTQLGRLSLLIVAAYFAKIC